MKEMTNTGDNLTALFPEPTLILSRNPVYKSVIAAVFKKKPKSLFLYLVDPDNSEYKAKILGKNFEESQQEKVVALVDFEVKTESKITAICWDPFGDRIAVGTSKGNLSIHNIHQGGDIVHTESFKHKITCLNWTLHHYGVYTTRMGTNDEKNEKPFLYPENQDMFSQFFDLKTRSNSITTPLETPSQIFDRLNETLKFNLSIKPTTASEAMKMLKTHLSLRGNSKTGLNVQTSNDVILPKKHQYREFLDALSISTEKTIHIRLFGTFSIANSDSPKTLRIQSNDSKIIKIKPNPSFTSVLLLREEKNPSTEKVVVLKEHTLQIEKVFFSISSNFLHVLSSLWSDYFQIMNLKLSPIIKDFIPETWKEFSEKSFYPMLKNLFINLKYEESFGLNSENPEEVSLKSEFLNILNIGTVRPAEREWLMSRANSQALLKQIRTLDQCKDALLIYIENHLKKLIDFMIILLSDIISIEKEIQFKFLQGFNSHFQNEENAKSRASLFETNMNQLSKILNSYLGLQNSIQSFSTESIVHYNCWMHFLNWVRSLEIEYGSSAIVEEPLEDDPANQLLDEDLDHQMEGMNNNEQGTEGPTTSQEAAAARNNHPNRRFRERNNNVQTNEGARDPKETFLPPIARKFVLEIVDLVNDEQITSFEQDEMLENASKMEEDEKSKETDEKEKPKEELFPQKFSFLNEVYSKLTADKSKTAQKKSKEEKPKPKQKHEERLLFNVLLQNWEKNVFGPFSELVKLSESAYNDLSESMSFCFVENTQEEDKILASVEQFEKL